MFCKFCNHSLTPLLHVYRISDQLVGLYFNVIKWVIHSLPDRTEPNPSLPGHRTLAVLFHELEGRVWPLHASRLAREPAFRNARSSWKKFSFCVFRPRVFPHSTALCSSFYAHIIFMVRNSDAVRLHPAYSLSDIIRFNITVWTVWLITDH